jgi:hypothetical protein
VKVRTGKVKMRTRRVKVRTRKAKVRTRRVKMRTGKVKMRTRMMDGHLRAVFLDKYVPAGRGPVAGRNAKHFVLEFASQTPLNYRRAVCVANCKQMA